MKVKKLVKALRKCNERIPIVARDKEGREFFLSWDYHDDGPDWAEFSFIVLDESWKHLDTDMAKKILDYVYSDPDNNRSLFSDDTSFLDYKLRITWPDNRDYIHGCGWEACEVKQIYCRETKKGRAMILLVDELPPWNDEDYDQEEVDRLREEAARRAKNVSDYIQGNIDRLYKEANGETENEPDKVQNNPNRAADEGGTGCG